MPTARDVLRAALTAALKTTPKNQKQIAEAAGVNQGYVSKLLKGKANVTLDTIDDLAGALDMNAGDLLRHWSDAESGLLGGPDVPASAAHARIRELEAALKDREAFIRQVQDAAVATVRLFGFDAIAAADRSARKKKRRSSGAHRKAG